MNSDELGSPVRASFPRLATEVGAALLRLSGLPSAVRRVCARRRATIIWYHDPDPATLARHLDYLSHRYSFISLDRLVDAIRNGHWNDIPDYPLVLTLDDGHRGNVELNPLFGRYGVVPILYLCSGVVGSLRQFWFMRSGIDKAMLGRQPHARRLEMLQRAVGFAPEKDYPSSERQALSVDELVAMEASVDFGSHSRTHPMLSTCTDEECREEVAGSRKDLETLLGRDCRHFSYPGGDRDERLREMVQEAGYSSARGIDVGWNGPDTDPYNLKGMGVADHGSVNRLAAELSGIPGLIRRLVGRPRGVRPYRGPSRFRAARTPARIRAPAPTGGSGREGISREVEISPFHPDDVSALRRLGERAWDRPRSEVFGRWRYIDCPSLDAIMVARRGNDCLATVSGMRRLYRVGGGTTACLEMFDWYCLPEWRRGGLGTAVMQALMERPEPVLCVVGTSAPVRLLPRMGWRVIATSHPFILPLDGSAMGAELRRRSGLPAPLGTGLFAVGVRTLLRPPNGQSLRGSSGQAPRAGRMIPVKEIGSEVTTLYDGPLGYGTVQIPDPSHQEWMERKDGGAGRYLAVRFDVEGEAVGWALGRVFSRGGVVEAAIVEIFAPRPTPALYEWMVGGMVSHLARLSPRFIRARATCPILGRALQRNRFLRGRPKPVLFWPGGGPPLPEPIHIARTAGDEPFSPYARGEGRGTQPG